MTKPSPTMADKVQSKARLRLDFLDGLRGLAAFYVLLHHVYFKFITDVTRWGDHPPQMPLGSSVLAYGRWAVDVFIVLSGYCLMLPVVRSRTHQLEGGTIAYLLRRAHRILPAYYAALLFSIALIVMGILVSQHSGVNRNMANDLTIGPILSHILLVQNLAPLWSGSIDAPMWSIATEWQIYFFLPLLLLPVWKRFGNAALLVVAFAVGLMPNLFNWQPLECAHSYLLGLFAFGMAGAILTFQEEKPGSLSVLRAWGTAALLGWLGIIAVGIFSSWYDAFIWQTDVLVGLATGCSLVYAAHVIKQNASKPFPVPVQILQAKVPVKLGHFSYSLYLVHSPILAICYLLIKRINHSVTQSFLLLLLVGVPLSLGVGYIFYVLFEKPFLKKRWSVTEAKSTADTVLAPAP